ncbi:MAG: efflux RND transporter permease subunit, partial [Tepidisphaeraceae bacterium]
HGGLYRASERFFQFILWIYEKTLAACLRHPFVMLIATVLTIICTVALYVIVPKGFFPQQDTGRMMGMILADQDISFQTMKRLLEDFAGIIGKDPGVENVIAFTGGGGAANSGRMFINLKPLKDRRLSADQIIDRVRPQLGRVPGAVCILQSVQDIRVGGRLGGGQYQYTLQGETIEELNEWAPKMLAKMRTLPGITDLTSDQQNRGLQAALVIDRATASRLGVSAQMIDDTLYDAFGQRQVSTMYTQLNQYHVVMEVDPQFNQNPEGLKQIYVKSTNAGQIPLSAVAHYATSTSALSIPHQGQFPAVTISFNLQTGYALGDAVIAVEKAARDMGLPGSIHGKFQGTAQAFQDSLNNQILLIIAALVTVYIVLGVLYESFIHPVTILSTLPSAGVGALVAMLAFRTELNVIGMIGIILLIGIVKKNAIMMIDFALAAERNEGKSPRDAIFQACLLRFRPITMTTMAAMLGGLPLALGTGMGAEMRRPLGIAIVGGLIFSQMLTLYTTPVIYLYLDRLRLWFVRLRAGTSPVPALPLET